MDLLNSLKHRDGQTFQIECSAIRGPIRVMNGSPTVPFRLTDMTDTIAAYTQNLQKLDELPGQIHETESPVRVTLKMERWERWPQRPVAKILEILPVTPAYPARCLPRSWCPRPEFLPKLAQIVERISFYPLTKFLSSVLTDAALMRQFLSIPSSVLHHHNYPAGNLIHTLECCTRLTNFLQSDEYEDEDLWYREVGIVACLFHDIGKVRTLRSDMSYDPVTLLMQHDMFTLEVLANHLSVLDGLDREIANSLRYILAWRPTARDRYPRMPIVKAVRLADEYSAATDAAKCAFQSAPAWQQLVTTTSNGPKQRYWRPRHHLPRNGNHQQLCLDLCGDIRGFVQQPMHKFTQTACSGRTT